MKKLVIVLLTLVCVGSFALSAAALTAKAVDSTTYSNIEVTRLNSVDERKFRFDNLGVNWKWTSDSYYDGAYVRFEYKGANNRWYSKTSQGFCEAGLNTVYCLRWTGANNDKNQTLRLWIDAHEIRAIPGPDPVTGEVPGYIGGYLSILSES